MRTRSSRRLRSPWTVLGRGTIATTEQRRLLLFIGVLTSVVSACGGLGPQVIPVEIRDNSVMAVSGRAARQFRTLAAGRIGELREHVAVQYVRIKGNDEQQLPPNHAVRFNGGAIVGPQTA